MNQLILYGIIIFVALIIIGIITGENQKAQKLLSSVVQENENIENFGPQTANQGDISSGSSTLYNWGVNDSTGTYATRVEQESSTPVTPINPPYCETEVECIPRPDAETTSSYPTNRYLNICRNCDITLNKDIDKYVLKSSVPPPVDMENYATKDMVCPQVNMDDYILKSEIPACPKVDMSQYILKSEIPACPSIPEQPICPKCPVCLPQERCKKIYEYKITEHPEFNKFVSKSDCEDTVRTAVESYVQGEQQNQEQLAEEESQTSSLLDNNTSGYGMYASFASCSPYSTES
jgi:hypothetical protein